MRNKVCGKCRVDLPIDHYYTYWCSERNKQRTHSKCIKCANTTRVEHAGRKRADGSSTRSDYERNPKRRFSAAKSLATRRGFSWSVSFEDFKALISLPCHYCGGKLPVTRGGLDRVENSKGYEYDNVVPCCTDCNRIKCHLLSHSEMYAVAALLKEMRK